MTAWVTRAGKLGENEQWNLEKGRACGGWSEIGDLTKVKTRDQLRSIVAEAFTDAPPMRVANYTGQLWALRNAIQPGDVIVMPRKRGGQIALGVCTAGYAYDPDQPDRSRRHHITVDWSPEVVSRSVLKDDLLYTINGAMTIFSASRNKAEARLRAVMADGTDPGADGVPGKVSPTKIPEDDKKALEESGVLDPTPLPTLQTIRDRISNHIVENFAGHGLTQLVAGVLTVLGWTCQVSPPGADRGVDIIAGRGPLGLDSPTLVVEVKSEPTAIGAPVVRGLSGARSDNGADQCLLVAWGGVTGPTRKEFSTQRTRLAIWTGEDLLDMVLEHYQELNEEIRARLPLKRVWVLDEDSDTGV